jgi:hypothetical protein
MDEGSAHVLALRRRHPTSACFIRFPDACQRRTISYTITVA